MKKNIYLILAFACILLFACANAKENKELLIGQWGTGISDTINNKIAFNKDNTMLGSLIETDNDRIIGKYDWSGKKSIVMSWSGISLGIIEPGAGLDIPVGIKVEVISLTEDSLIMTLQGNKLSYHRINE